MIDRLKDNWHFLLVVAVLLCVWGTAWGYAEFVNKPRCEAIWAQARIVVTADIWPPACVRTTAPIRTKIPTDEMLEMATLDPGPALTRSAAKERKQ